MYVLARRPALSRSANRLSMRTSLQAFLLQLQRAAAKTDGVGREEKEVRSKRAWFVAHFVSFFYKRYVLLQVPLCISTTMKPRGWNRKKNVEELKEEITMVC